MNKPTTSDPQGDVEPILPTSWDDADKDRFWTSPQFVRFIVIPAAVSLILAGGVLWIRAQLPSDMESAGEPAIVQVQLLRRPNPAPIPTPVVSPTAYSTITTEKTDFRHETDVESASATEYDSTDTSAPAADTAMSPAIDDVPTPLGLQPNNAIANFQQALLRQIRRYQRYPEAARQEGLQGTVETYFVVRRDGTLVDARVQSSAGQLLLDDAAIEAIRRAQPFPSIPAGLPDLLGIRLGIAFSPS